MMYKSQFKLKTGFVVQGHILLKCINNFVSKLHSCACSVKLMYMLKAKDLSSATKEDIIIKAKSG